GMKASATGKWWMDPANAPVRAALSQQLDALGSQIEAKLGCNPLQAFGLLHGRVAFAANGAMKPDAHSDTPVGLSFALLADTGADHAAVEKIVTTLTGKLAEQDEVVSKSTSVGKTEVSVFELMKGKDEPAGRLQVAFHGDTLVVTLAFLPVAHDLMEQLLS